MVKSVDRLSSSGQSSGQGEADTAQRRTLSPVRKRSYSDISHGEEEQVTQISPLEQYRQKYSQEALDSLGYKIRFIEKGLESQYEETRDFFLHSNPEKLEKLGHLIEYVQKGLDSRHQACRDYFLSCKLEDLKKIGSSLQYIQKGLDSQYKECRDFFLEHKSEDLKKLGISLLYIQEGLDSQHQICRDYFLEHKPEVLAKVDYKLQYIQKGIESQHEESRGFFLSHKLEEVAELGGEGLKHIQKGLESQHQTCRDYFLEHKPEVLATLGWGLEYIQKGLESQHQTCRNYFLEHKPEEFAKLNHILGSNATINNMLKGTFSYFQKGLDSENEDCRKFFAQQPLEALDAYDGVNNHLSICEIYNAFQHNNPVILGRLEAEKNAATSDYLDLRPEGVSEEQMQENIEGLYERPIEEVIEYSQRAIEELGLKPDYVYSRRMNKKKFDALCKEREQYAKSETFAASEIGDLPVDILRAIGSFSDVSERPLTELMITKSTLGVGARARDSFKPREAEGEDE